jgi:hypothetical protein
MQRKKTILLLGAFAVVFVSAFGLPFGAFSLDSHVAKAYVSPANLGQVVFPAGSPALLYSTAGGDITSILLPADADKNGFDAYIVWKCKFIDDVLWVGVFTGADLPGWLPYSSTGGAYAPYPFDPAVCPK